MQASPFYSEAHEAFRATVRRFVATEIEPYAAAWDEAETFPRELYQKAAAIGLLQMGFRAADRRRRLRGAEGARAARRAVGPRDQRTRDYRAGRRLRRRQSENAREARRRPLNRQWQKNLHHLGHARRLVHGGGAHGRRRKKRNFAAGDPARRTRLHPHAAEKDGLVGVGYGDALFRELQ